MLGFFRRICRVSSGPDDPGPLDHPDIARMSPRELADLPFPGAEERTGGKVSPLRRQPRPPGTPPEPRRRTACRR